jgi:hypothetical protein
MESIVMAEFRRDQYNRILKNFEGFNKYEIRKIIVAAADRAASAGVTATKKGISREFTISGSALGKAVKKYKYGSGLGMAIGVKIRDNNRPLSEFKFGPKKHSARPTVEVKRGSPHVLKGSRFVAEVHGRTAILERTSKKRYPVRALQGPSAVGMFKANESIHQAVWDIIFEKFEERVIHEIDRMLKIGRN